jgi:hypothetical protein
MGDEVLKFPLLMFSVLLVACLTMLNEVRTHLG